MSAHHQLKFGLGHPTHPTYDAQVIARGEEQLCYDGPFVKVTTVHREGLTWEKVHLRAGIIVFALNSAGELIMIEEYRPHETPNVRAKMITGNLELDLTILENAQKELREEIGQRALKLEHFLSTKSTGTINSEQHFVLAKDLSLDPLPNPDLPGSIRRIFAIHPLELKKQLFEETIPWGQWTVGFFRLLPLLGY